MAYIYTLKLSGIEGESEVENHIAEIDVDEVLQDYEAPGELDRLTAVDQTEIRPAVVCRGLTILKKYEKSTPGLLQYLTEGKQIDNGVVTCFGSDNREFLTITMRDLLVRRINLVFDSDRIRVEVNFSYLEINHTYTPDGAKQGLFTYRKSIPFS